jgi:hypothetical protein
MSSTITIGSNTYTLCTMPLSPGPSEIELGMNDSVAVFTSPFSQVQQTQQWPGGDYWDATITLPSMYISQSFAWEAFLAELHGRANVFQLGDTRNVAPQGSGLTATTTATGTLDVASVLVFEYRAPSLPSYTEVTFTTPVPPGLDATYTFAGLTTYTDLNGQTLTAYESDGDTARFTGALGPIGSGSDTGSASVTYTIPSSALVHTTGDNNLPMTTSLVTEGWADSQTSVLLPGDKIQVGYRLYKVCEAVNSDSSGNATIIVWPSLRETPADETLIVLTNPVGLFRLTQNRRAIHWSPTQLTTVSIACVEAR